MSVLRKIVLYIKNLFAKKTACFGNLDKSLSEADNAISEYDKVSRRKTDDIVMSAMAYRHMCTVRNHIRRMRRTTEPEVFFSSFKAVTLLADRIRGMESVNTSLYNAAENIIEIFTEQYVPIPVSNEGLVYYGVTFGGGGKEYYYLSDDMPCEEGQYVLVPVGGDNEQKIGRVEGVYHFTATNVPMPPDKLKSVIEIVI